MAFEASEEVKQKLILEEDEEEYWQRKSSPLKKGDLAKTLTNRDLKNFPELDPLSPMSATRASYRRGPTSISGVSSLSKQYEEQKFNGSGEKTTIVKQKTRRKKNTLVQKKKIVLQ